MNKHLFFLFVIITSITFAQGEIGENDHKILWKSSNQLKWSDFLGSPKEPPVNQVAVTHSVISVKESYKKGIPSYWVDCYFDKNLSWTLVNDSLTLEHKQMHFNITELFVRKMRSEISCLKRKKNRDLKSYRKVIKDLMLEYEGVQLEFDSETNFNLDKHKEWAKYILHELRKLEKYEYIID